MEGSILETSQDSALSLSILSDHSASPQNSHAVTPSKFTSGLLFLRSPGPEDFKKKKGWSSSTKGQKSISASQESKTELSSTPGKTESEEKGCEGFPKSELSSYDDNEISYSPISEFPAENEVIKSKCSKALFNNHHHHDDDDDDDDTFENKDSMVLFSDGFSSEDELLTEFIDNLETSSVPVKDQSSLNNQLESFASLAPTHQLPASRVAENRADSTGNKATNAVSKTNVQSPPSIVLERLRENILNSENQHFKNFNDSIQSEPGNTNSHQLSLSQTSAVQTSQTMPPQKKTSQTSCLKQTDIGVFFGIKPLKEKEKETEIVACVPTLGENTGQRQQRRDRQRKSKADTTADTSQSTVTVDSSDVVNAQGESSKGGTRGWRRRWNRGLPRCPFYKKLPGQRCTYHKLLHEFKQSLCFNLTYFPTFCLGTKFVVDAFRYGEIEGITAYFLTHFHSDHYGGLTKNSTFPIYCNKVSQVLAIMKSLLFSVLINSKSSFSCFVFYLVTD